MKKSFEILHTIRIEGNAIFLDEVLVFAFEGDLETFLIEAYKHLGISYPKFYKMDKLSKLGFLGAEYLMKENSFELISPYKKGIIMQNVSSSLETDQKYQESIIDIASPALFVYTLPNIVMGEIAIRNKFKGENTFFVTSEYAPEQLDEYTAMLFEQDIVQLCIVGFVEPTLIMMKLCRSFSD